MMGEVNESILKAKEELMKELGDKDTQYLYNLKMWFRQKWSREEFDKECRKLLSDDKVHLHNQLFLALLNKIDSLLFLREKNIPFVTNSSENKNKKRKRRSSAERETFELNDICNNLQEENTSLIKPPNFNKQNLQFMPTQRYCAQELFLPDISFIMGRLLVGAWENGLVNVDDNVSEYICIALKIFLKNIITTIILKRRNVRVTGEGTFYYDVGAPIQDPFLRNTIIRQNFDKEIIKVDFQRKPAEDPSYLSACEELCPNKKLVINLRDFYKALQDKNTLGSHMIYSVNMERIIQMIHDGQY